MSCCHFLIHSSPLDLYLLVHAHRPHRFVQTSPHPRDLHAWHQEPKPPELPARSPAFLLVGLHFHHRHCRRHTRISRRGAAHAVHDRRCRCRHFPLLCVPWRAGDIIPPRHLPEAQEQHDGCWRTDHCATGATASTTYGGFRTPAARYRISASTAAAFLLQLLLPPMLPASSLEDHTHALLKLIFN